MKFSITGLSFYEREVRLRMPFRFGAVTLTQAPQAFVRARIRVKDKEAEGAAAEMLVPKWFDKDPELTNEQNIEQLRSSLALARDGYLAGGENTAFGHSIEAYGPQIALGAVQGMNSLVACFGPALIDRAVLDALCRSAGLSFYQCIQKNVAGITAPGWQQDLMAFDMDEFLYGLKPATQIAARHTVGLLDPITESERKVDDDLPSTLEDVITVYGHKWFKLKVAGDVKADIERLAAIAGVLDKLPEYQVTLDGNEQYNDPEGALELWKRMKGEARLKRLMRAVAFIEQPVKRQNALSGDVSDLGEERPVIIDESDDSLEAFPRARRLGYTGVSSKTCKGFYKSLLNAARCRMWNMEEASSRYFMSGEDLTVQAGIALQQDLALVSLLGLKHVERNGHHYVNGMAGLPEAEQEAFLKGHQDLYEKSHGAVRLKIADGMISTRSLDCPGFASRALPDWSAMKEMP
jgi:L-alanine-DL-glutamate epimerase-like enolase superfamily enzyme